MGSNIMRRFKQLAKEEGLKCDGRLVLLNVDGYTYTRKRKKAVVPKAGKVDKDCILVTILVAVEGRHKLPTIHTANSVKRALRYLEKICKCETTMALEVFWTPQDENDALSFQELLKKYPHLTRIRSSC
ncbi:hypothetical protein COLO4_04728 [Corchorus olitorius]|uniref:Uncharacterized protein n=1 Tax=Corchorus olitorius TaxID=93759 RepID=A0A1R3KT24_9ROSI|nr:hypothetical protein COLO4_04728 [Corchorus olitorius]